MDKITLVILTAMLTQSAKSILYSHKSVIMGLVLVLLAIVLFCGHFQVLNRFAGAESVECNKASLIAAGAHQYPANLRCDSAAHA